MDGDNALSSAKRVSREPPRHDGMVIASFTEHGERQEAGRIRGGCCPGGSVWTCTSRSEEDDVKGEQVQRDRQEQRAQQMREEGPSPLLLALQQSQSQPTENVPSAPTLAARIPQVTPAPHPNRRIHHTYHRNYRNPRGRKRPAVGERPQTPSHHKHVHPTCPRIKGWVGESQCNLCPR